MAIYIRGTNIPCYFSARCQDDGVRPSKDWVRNHLDKHSERHLTAGITGTRVSLDKVSRSIHANLDQIQIFFLFHAIFCIYAYDMVKKNGQWLRKYVTKFHLSP